MTKRELQAIETKKNLLSAAEKLIEEKGFSNTSINDITDACGVATGTLYLYFKNKDEILLQLSKNIHEKLEQQLEEVHSDSALEKLRFIITEWLRFVSEQGRNTMKQIYRYYIETTMSGERDTTANRIDYEVNLVSSCLMAAVENGELNSDTPVDFLGLLIGMEMHGASSYYCSDDTSFNPIEWGEKYSDYILRTMLRDYII